MIKHLLILYSFFGKYEIYKSSCSTFLIWMISSCFFHPTIMPCIILSISINLKFLIKRFHPKVCLTSTQKFKDESLYTHQRSTQTVFEYARSIKPIIHFVYNIHNLPLFLSERRDEIRTMLSSSIVQIH